MTFLDAKYNAKTMSVLNEHEMLQPKLGNLEMLTNDYDKSEAQSDNLNTEQSRN